MAKARGGKLSPATEFKPGVSGNPNGRPKKIPAIDKLLSDKPESEYQSVIESLFNKAKRGDVRAIEVLLDRAYGKAKQELKLDQPNSKQIMIIGGQQIEF